VRPSLARILARYFPVTRHLGVRVREASLARVVLAAPLAPNRNRSGTAFAGSLNAVATLAGWSWLTLLLQEAETPAQVVLQDSSIVYSSPATTDFLAVCMAPSVAEQSRFQAAFHRRGRGRISLRVVLESKDGPVATFLGRYVAQVQA
jgi:thioesterase domain-containing protein